MKVSKPVGNMTVHGEGENLQEVFKELAMLEEIFSIQKCGRCKGPVKHVHRTVDEMNFYEVECLDWKNCRAKLQFGCTKKGNSLFPGKMNQETKKVERKWQTLDEIKAERGD